MRKLYRGKKILIIKPRQRRGKKTNALACLPHRPQHHETKIIIIIFLSQHHIRGAGGSGTGGSEGRGRSTYKKSLPTKYKKIFCLGRKGMEER